MGKARTEINSKLEEFINKQKMFFVGTAASSGRVNISPKGMDTLKVLGPNKVVWLNLTGSGNETAAHVLQNDRMTLMFCAFEGPPMILRLYGSAKIYHQYDEAFQQLSEHFPAIPGSRQIIVLNIDLVQTSCGYGVPLYNYESERNMLDKWAEEKNPEGIRDYWQKNNMESLDGFETRIFQE